MKSCPTCQQTFTDAVGTICPNDATQLIYAPEPGASYDNQSQWQPGAMGGWGSPPSGQYNYAPPPPAPQGGGGGLSTTALLCGICATVFPLLAFALASSARGYAYGQIRLAVILVYLTIIMGLTAINLGIVAICLSNRDAARKTKGIIGLFLGILPFFVFMVLVLNANGPMRLF